MNVLTMPVPPRVAYPESDGEPMSDNTIHFRWIVLIYANLAALFHDNPQVFVSGNLLWYPVEGQPEIRSAPDVLVVFGRPKGDRGSWLQWLEDNTPLTVVFEILSPTNDAIEMADKLCFFDDYGVEEYYLYDPYRNRLAIYVRQGVVLRRVWKVAEFISPRLGIRFDLSGLDLVIIGPDGKRFLTVEELKVEQVRDQLLRQESDHRAEQARQLAARLAELGRKARLGHATAEELAELDRLETEAGLM
jgi:Uma2 family endonuclease